MKDAGGGQQKRDDAGDAEEEWRDRRGEAGWQRDASQRGQPELMELIFPFSGTAHQNSFHPLAQGKDLPLPGQGGSRSWGGGQEPPVPPLFPPALGVALPSPPLPGPGSPGVSPQNPSTVGSLQGAWQPRSSWGTRSFGTPRSQAAFDASSGGTRKISLQYQNPP